MANESATVVVSTIDGPGEQSSKLGRKLPRGIFVKRGYFWIAYVDGQGRYRREKAAGTLEAAKKLRAKRITQSLQLKKLPETLRRREVLFSEIAEDAIQYSRANKRSARSDEIMKRNLAGWFGTTPADGLLSSDIESRLEKEGNGRNWAPSTFNHYRAFLMLAYREGRRCHKVCNNPARDVRHRRENNSRVRFLSRGENGEYARLHNAIRENYSSHLAEFTFALGTGLRLGSQYGATYEMIDWDRRMLGIPRTKNDDPVHVPLSDDVISAIRTLPSWRERTGPVFRNQHCPDKPVLSNDHWFKPALKSAGVYNFKWHDLRHTTASWMIQDGIPLERVSKLLGHKSLAMTMRYAHLAPGQLHDDVAVLQTAMRNSTTIAPAPNVTVSDMQPVVH